MAALTKLEDLYYGQLETVDNPNPKLAAQLEENALIIPITAPIVFTSGTTVNKPFLLSIRDLQTKEPELIYVQAGELSIDGRTITLAGLNQRGLPYDVETTIDFFSGDATRRVTHVVSSPVRISIAPQTQVMLVQFVQGLIASGANIIKIGDETDSDVLIQAKNADATPPFLKYIASSNKWVFSNDGVTELDLATGGISTAGDGIDITAGTIKVDLGDTTTFVATSAGAGDTGKAFVLDASGQIDETFKGSTFVEEEQALSGIGGTVTAANLNTVTDGSDADALHAHPSLVASFDSQIITKNAADASTTQNIVHGLGRVPKRINFQYINRTLNITVETTGFGVWDGSGQRAINQDASSNSAAIYIKTGSSSTQIGTIQNVTSSDFDIDWVDGGAGGTYSILITIE